MGTFDKRRRHQAGPKNSRRGLRPWLVFAALAALAVVLVPTGSAKPPTASIKLYDVCLQGGTTACTSWSSTGGSTSTISGANPQVTFNVHNESKSNTTLGSLNLDMPSGITLQTVSDPLAGTSTSTQLQLRNLNLAAGSSYPVTFTISAPSTCGTVQWNGVAAKQSNDFNGSGNDYQLTQSGGLTSLITNGCHLAWIHQPASAIQSTPITDKAFTPADAVHPDVHNVTVAIEDASNTPINLNTGTATLAVTGSYDPCTPSPCSPTFINTTSTFQSGVATFPNFQGAATGTGFTATASALGLNLAASSPPFVIQTNGVDCAGQDPCLLNGGAGDVQINASANGGSFLFIAVGPATAPASVIGAGGGCANFGWTFNDGFALTDGRTAQGTVDVTVSIPQNDLKRVYGPNYGQPNVPICAGAMRLDPVTQQPINCNSDPNGGWADRTLVGSPGKFNGGYSTAVCDPGTGYWWGILGTFQDPNPPFDSNSIPLITGWGSSPDGVYRTFTIHEPAGWDGHYVP